jgi:hypothetical protein
VNFFDYTMEHVRISVLRTLAEAPGYSANDSVLASAMNALGLAVTRDQLRTQIGWLEEQGLLRTEQPLPALTVATITERGCDVAAGHAFVRGIQRPAPGR